MKKREENFFLVTLEQDSHEPNSFALARKEDNKKNMSVSDIRIPSSTLAELRGVLVRALSRENLSVTDKIAIRRSQSSSTLKIHYTAHYGGKASHISSI